MNISTDTQAALLLTAPLIVGGSAPGVQPLTGSEARRLVRMLRADGARLSSLLDEGSPAARRAAEAIGVDRLQALLQRGLLLAQALEAWQSRAIWVVGSTDKQYPARLVDRLGYDAPMVMYGCGELGLLGQGGLAVVGSRNVDDALITYTENLGALAAHARVNVVSGGARGIDQAAMRGALIKGGSVVGVLSDSLARAAIARGHRESIMDGRLTLVSPYDPGAGFNIGNAMQRNKLIYALADAALVVSCEVGAGGTWAGATEQLDKRRSVPVFVRPDRSSQGLIALKRKGALRWPEPDSPSGLVAALAAGARGYTDAPAADLALALVHEAAEPVYAADAARPVSGRADELLAKVREIVCSMDAPCTEAQIAAELGVLPGQARAWLSRLVQDGSLERLPRPVRYRRRVDAPSLFGAVV